jgi:peptide/nickel transport system permease protein
MTTKQFIKNPMILAGIVILSIIFLAVIFGPIFSPYHWSDLDGTMKFKAPSAQHWLGTNRIGQDLLVNICEGGRISLLLASVAVIPYTLFGTLFGLVCGYGNSRLNFALSQFMTFIQALPLLPLIMMMGIFLSQLNFSVFQILLTSIVLYSFFSTPTLFKVVRAETMRIRSEDYLLAAEVSGVSRWAILFKHLFPNLRSHVIVSSIQFMAQILIIELMLSFIGIGFSGRINEAIQPTWGNLIPNIIGPNAFKEYYWTWLYPIGIVAVTTIGLRLLSEGLRVAFDPKAQL